MCRASLPVLCRTFFYYVAHFLAAARDRCLSLRDRLFEFEIGTRHGLVLGMLTMQFDLLMTRADEYSRLYLASVDFNFWHKRGIVKPAYNATIPISIQFLYQNEFYNISRQHTYRHRNGSTAGCPTK